MIDWGSYSLSPMKLNDQLRVAAFCTYLAAWLVLGIAALAGAIPRRRQQSASAVRMPMPVVIGMLLQSTAALPITLSLRDGPLRPRTFELIGTLVLAPLAAALFVWALLSVRSDAEPKALATQGAYAWLRHPIYLAFLAMLLATGFLTSAGVALAAATVLYVAGSELRIAAEEADLEERFPADYKKYRMKTRWRYLPGLR